MNIENIINQDDQIRKETIENANGQHDMGFYTEPGSGDEMAQRADWRGFVSGRPGYGESLGGQPAIFPVRRYQDRHAALHPDLLDQLRPKLFSA